MLLHQLCLGPERDPKSFIGDQFTLQHLFYRKKFKIELPWKQNVWEKNGSFHFLPDLIVTRRCDVVRGINLLPSSSISYVCFSLRLTHL